MKPIRDDLPNKLSPQEHVDEVRLVVRLTSSPANRADDVTAGFLVGWDGIDVTLEEAARYSTAVAWDEEAKIFHSFVVAQRYSQFEWGASGSALEFAVDVVNNVSAELVLAGMGYAVAKIRGNKRSKTRWSFLEDAAGLRHTATEATSQIFGVAYDDLEVTRVTLHRKSVELRLRSSHARFRAKVGRLDSGDPYVVVERK